MPELVKTALTRWQTTSFREWSGAFLSIAMDFLVVLAIVLVIWFGFAVIKMDREMALSDDLTSVQYTLPSPNEYRPVKLAVR